MKIYVLLGNTGVGKDTLAEAMVKKCQPMIIFKVVAALKRDWERQWELPYGALELRDVKGMYHPGTNLTYHQLMVNEFLKSQSTPEYRRPLIDRMRNELKWCCDNMVDVVCTDIRSEDEARVLEGFIYDGEYVRVLLLERDDAQPLESDKHLRVNYNRLLRAGAYPQMLSYNGTTEQWLREILGV